MRSLANKERVEHLLRDFPGLELFEADLLQDGSFDKCFAGATAVLHTASPFQLTVADPQRDLIVGPLRTKEPKKKGKRKIKDEKERKVRWTRFIFKIILSSGDRIPLSMARAMFSTVRVALALSPR